MSAITGRHISIGARGEALAVQFLSGCGYEVITQNYKVKVGEIDIIAREAGDLVFIEVKTRSNTNFGLPAEAVGLKKQAKIIRVAQYYLTVNDISECAMRFDVVSVLLAANGQPVIEVIKHAFEQQ